MTYSLMSLLGPAGAGLETQVQNVLFPEHVELSRLQPHRRTLEKAELAGLC